MLPINKTILENYGFYYLKLQQIMEIFSTSFFDFLRNYYNFYLNKFMSLVNFYRINIYFVAHLACFYNLVFTTFE